MTELLPANDAGIARAAALLRAGRLVAFGTETVYGLGARADNAAAVAAVFTAKGRPASNPLICHYASIGAMAADVHLSDAARALADAFWPGPLTLVLQRRQPGRIATGVSPPGTLAVRVPAHDVALRLLAEVGVPVAAPSANRSGRISPTLAAHVVDELGGRIDAVLDCGACAVGLESTVVDLTGNQPVLLRAGGIAQPRIVAVAGPLGRHAGGVLTAPGQLAAHYAPALPLRLAASGCGPDEALLAFGPPAGAPGLVYQLSQTGDLAQAAARLFAGLRWLDTAGTAAGLRRIAVMAVPLDGLGAAINDRLARAAVGSGRGHHGVAKPAQA